MKKVSFLLDNKTDSYLKTLARCEGVTKSDLLRRIVRKEVKEMAYRAGIMNRHEIEKFINK